MWRNKWVRRGLVAFAAVCILGLLLSWVLRRGERGLWETSCVGSLCNFRFMVREALDTGKAPPRTDTTRRGSELNAVLALEEQSRGLSRKFWCYGYTYQHGKGERIESYRMPDWTFEQWQKADNFLLKMDSDGDGVEEWYAAPAIWDTEPVHDSRRNVLFLDSTIRARVPEDIFQQLRKASEEFVRKPTPKTESTDQSK